MSIPFGLLILLIGTTPAIVFVDGALARAIAAVVAAVAVAAVAIFLRPGEGGHLQKLLRSWVPVAAVPALWMIIQVIPVPASLANPIWASVASALNRAITGSISIDPGMTVIAFGRYLFAIGIIFIAAAVTIERRRAELVLLVLAAAAAVMAALFIAGALGSFAFAASDADTARALRAASALGVVLCFACVIHAAERIETQRNRTARAIARSAGIAAVWVVAAVLCGVAVLRSPPQIMFAAGCGLAVLILVVAARRLNAGPIVGAAVTGVALLAAVLLATSNSDRHGDATLRFAVAGPTAAIERMMADTPLAGSGAGTYAALLPVYGSIEELAGSAAPPTTASAVVVELGWPMLALLVLTGIAAAAVLLHGAMLRGRDSFFPAAGAGCIVLVVFESFIDASLFDSAVLTLAAAAIGLGLAQSASRTAR